MQGNSKRLTVVKACLEKHHTLYTELRNYGGDIIFHEGAEVG